MATLGQNKGQLNLLRGLSSFWNRFFNDKETLQNLYAATDQLMGQLYLELLEVLLTNSVTTVPVFSKEFWKLLTFTSDEVVIEGLEYKFLLKDKVRSIKFIYNKVFSPTTIFENNVDYRIQGEYIYFSKNIFDDLEAPGFAKRRSGSVTTISLWVPEAELDKEYIYEHYGRMLDIYEPSTESYKSFIQGVWFYYMNGPTINRIKSAMNIIGGYPVASEDGEIVLAIDYSDNTYYIKTTVTTYEIPDDVGVSVTVGQTLTAFQSLTDAYTVTDYIDDPHWFDHIIVPIEVIPSLSTAERTTNVNDFDPIFIGYPIVIGHPGWYIGTGGLPNFMWLLFNGVLKYNIFYVTYNALASRFVRSTDDLNSIVLSGKPAWDLALVVPYLKVQDTVEAFDEEEIQMDLTFNLASTYNIGAIGDVLGFESELAMTQDVYGKVPIDFENPACRIGAGYIGDPMSRLLAGVPELIGTDTIGLTESGLYTEFPVEIYTI